MSDLYPSGTAKPITVQEVEEARLSDIPNIVVEGFNDLITRNYVRNANCAIITLDEALEYISAAMAAEFGVTNQSIATYREELLANHWMDVEGIFRKAGWKVVFDKPAYNESYKAHYKFSKV